MVCSCFRSLCVIFQRLKTPLVDATCSLFTIKFENSGSTRYELKGIVLYIILFCWLHTIEGDPLERPHSRIQRDRHTSTSTPCQLLEHLKFSMKTNTRHGLGHREDALTLDIIFSGRPLPMARLFKCSTATQTHNRSIQFISTGFVWAFSFAFPCRVRSTTSWRRTTKKRKMKNLCQSHA